ncbi:FadR/GntR family transcriptional regulator [Cryptosporangium arvum]|uniref:FadR/GntR family transcriptional regulator n=1 Tax=Cryptosporangium arvum TaxID=80871 RepID=UPI0004B5654B|nr:GntR family transcriptional regulator [Cryptosporangium arvum]
MGTRRFNRGPRSALFAPLESLSRTELVTHRLADAIMLGLLTDAEQLPSETALATGFGVSTVTVREALTALRQRGLIETRRGRGGGSFVRSPAEDTTEVLRERLRDYSPSTLRDIGDHYAAISGAAAELAAERADRDDVARLRSAVATLETAVRPGDRRRADGHFSIEVAAAAQSARLTRAEMALQTEVGPLFWLVMVDDAAHSLAVERCRALTAAVDEGDGPRARAAAQERISDAVSNLTERHLELIRQPRE